MKVVTFKEFAALVGKRPSWVTQLRKDDRLVLDETGRKVVVDASLARIEATRDPALLATVERHAAAREKSTAGGEGSATAGPVDDDASAATNPDQPNYQSARASKEHYLALAARRDYEISIGNLLARLDVERSVADAITTLRARLESLPGILAPELAMISNEAAARALIAEYMERALADTATAFRELAGGVATERAA